MAVFEYKALNASGRQVKGTVDADTVRAARQKLKQQGIFPTSVVEAQAKETSRSWNVTLEFKRRRVGTGQLAVSTRQLATLVGAGMPLVEALKALGEQIDHARLKRIVADITDQVNEGSTLADALREHSQVFPRIYINMIASGEASGSLELVLERLADLLEGQAELQRKVFSALTYPVLMLLLCFGVIVLLLSFVVPQITAIFAEHERTLPLPTRVIIFLSDVAQSGWFWLLFIAVATCLILTVIWYGKTGKGRRRIDSIKLRTPIVGSITLKIATSRFARNLGTMLTSGIPLLSALGIARNIVGNALFEDAVDSAVVGVREGRALASELNKSGVFPILLVRMIAIGEKTGQLEPMLLRAATSYESEVNAVISTLTSILEPLLILVIAGIVGCILASVMLPMLEMSSLTGI